MEGLTESTNKLKAALDAGDLYSALQIFKTQIERLKKKGEHQHAQELAYTGAVMMLEKGEVTSGGDLARHYVQICKDEGVKYNEEKMKQLIGLDVAFSHHQTEQSIRERRRFIKLAIEYTGNPAFGEYVPYGAPELHQVAALSALKEQDLLSATRHFLHAHKAKDLASVLVRWSANGPEHEKDLFLARAVLQLCCLENLRDAHIVYNEFKLQAPKCNTPLVRYLGFLLYSLERDAFALFQAMRQKYGPSLARGNDAQPTFEQYLDKIAFVYYGVKPKGSMLETMMANMFGGNE